MNDLLEPVEVAERLAVVVVVLTGAMRDAIAELTTSGDPDGNARRALQVLRSALQAIRFPPGGLREERRR